MNNVIVTNEENTKYVDENKVLGLVVFDGLVEIHFQSEDDAFEHSHLSLA